MAHKIKYKAIYHDPNQNPFNSRGISVPTKTVEVDEDVPLAQVEAWAREAQEDYVFQRVEIVS